MERPRPTLGGYFTSLELRGAEERPFIIISVPVLAGFLYLKDQTISVVVTSDASHSNLGLDQTKLVAFFKGDKNISK